MLTVALQLSTKKPISPLLPAHQLLSLGNESLNERFILRPWHYLISLTSQYE